MKPSRPDPGGPGNRRAGRPETRAAPRWVVWSLRTTVVSTLLIFVQALLAGGFVSGRVDLLSWHDVNSNAITTVQFAAIVGAVGLWWRGRGPHWPIWVALLLTTAAETQKFLGYFRVVDLHIPLGVALFGGSVAFAVWTLGPLRVAAPGHSAAERSDPEEAPRS